MKSQRFDQTLVDVEIEVEAEKNNLIAPFNIRKLRGASYDLSVGAKAVIATPEKLDWISLDEQKILILPPSRTCVIWSFEKLNMPADMKGRLSLRSHFAMQRLEYNGGVVDPGYHGYLFFTLANLGDAPVEINFEESLVTIEFVRMRKEAKRLYNDGFEILRLEDRQQAPKLPPLPKEQYDPIELSGRVQELEREVVILKNTLDKFEPSLQVTEDIVQSLILASVAGIIAGLVLFVLPYVNQYPVNLIFLAAFIILVGVLLGVRVRRNRKNTWRN
ncbi:MAG: hypothetical protein AB1607_11915 [Chloroflexota bacterium]